MTTEHVRGQIRWLPGWVPITADEILLIIAGLIWIPFLIDRLR